MQTHRIDDIDQFDQLKEDWERIYAADPKAHIFVSWTWLRGWFEMTPYAWFVLAVRPDDESDYVAFLPLLMRGPRVHSIRLISVLHMGGQPLAAYTGFVCDPEYEEESLAALARYIQNELSWDGFQMEQVLDPRLDFFLKCFSSKEFNVQQIYGMPSLYVSLPGSWDEYLRDYLGRETRRTLKRRMNKFESMDEFHRTQAHADNVERHVEALLTLWHQRWGPKLIAHWQRKIIRYYFENKGLWLGILWDNTTPISGQAALFDRPKKALYTYLTGYDAKYAKLSPGSVIIGYCIKYATENGIELCDFLSGADKYKYSLGARQRSTRNITISRTGFKSTIANTMLSLTREAREALVKLLGRFKRTEFVKKKWKWLLPHIGRARS